MNGDDMSRYALNAILTGVLMACITAVIIVGVVTGHDVSGYTATMGTLFTTALAGLTFATATEVRTQVNGRMTDLIQGLANSAPVVTPPIVPPVETTPGDGVAP